MPSKIAKHILAAAVELFSQHGIDGTTTKEIAMKADVTEGSLFRLFGSKDNLFEVSLRKVVDDQMSQDEFSLLVNRKGPFVDIVHDAIRRWYKAETREYFRLVMFANLSRPKLAQTIVGPRAKRFVEILADRIDREFGKSNDSKARVLAWALISDLFVLKLNRGVYDRGAQEREFVDALIELWSQSIGANRGK